MSSVKVNEDKCIGCGACVAIAPNNFDFNDEGLSKVISEEVTEETVNACEACPVFAIEVENEACDCVNGGECTCGDECHCGDECNCGDDCCCGDDCDCDEEDDCDCECCHCCHEEEGK